MVQLKLLIATVGDIADKEFNNRVTPPEEPKFQPEKYVVSEEKFDITGDKLVDDDKELGDKYADTNANPYADDASNNEEQNSIRRPLNVATSWFTKYGWIQLNSTQLTRGQHPISRNLR